MVKRDRSWDNAHIQIWIDRDYYYMFLKEKNPEETMGSFIEFLYEFYKTHRDTFTECVSEEKIKKMMEENSDGKQI